ncbi:hypothetical protein CW357_09395 [Rummeliibacillus sp. TYF005]|nr:hypothetical protein D1606_08915 [Rummeliibacillus sp. POC4]RPJ95669.1 hypothetical protein CW357_09395 [Rummeliibacillus sp. TYF005]
MFVKMKLSFASFVHKIRAIEGGKFMLKFGQFLLRNFLNLLIAMTTLMICNWSFDINFWISSLLAIVSYLLSNIIIKNIQYLRYLKRNGLNRSEYKHIQEQLAEAYSLLKNLNRNYTKVRSISMFKQLLEMNRLAKRIYHIVKKSPKKFYQAEQFFYAHLHSASELTEKYVLLSTQPIKNKEIHLALQETRETLEDLNNVMQKDLQSVLATDIEELKMELDFAQLSTAQNQTSATMRGESK